MANGDECYLMGGPVQRSTQAVPLQKIAPVPAPPAASTIESARKAVKDTQGRVRCKRLGCQQTFDPDGPAQNCVYHKARPVFHETAKWWSCCPDRKAYDFDEFMQIPGCQTGFCTSIPQGKDDNKALGGVDLRNDSAPRRLDADAPPDPRQKLSALRRGLIAVGVDGELFDRQLSVLAGRSPDNLESVCEALRGRFTALLGKVASS